MLLFSVLLVLSINTQPVDDVIALGREVYLREGSCATCHQPDGIGRSGEFPTLAGTLWVNDREDRLIKIVLHGFKGPAHAGDVTYDAECAALGEFFEDREIAAVLTYIRSSWENHGAAVKPYTVARLRRKYAGRKTPWNAADLEYTRDDGSDRVPEAPQSNLSMPLMLTIVIVANVVIVVGLVVIYRATRQS